MNYQLMIRARPHIEMSARHDRFMSHWAELKNAWGLARPDWPPAKDPRSSLLSIVNLKKYVQKGIKEANIHYQNRNRRDFADEACYDDYFCFEFDPGKFPYDVLVNEVFEKYLDWFDAYVGSIEDIDLMLSEMDQWRSWGQSGNNDRSGVFRFWPVSFFDRELCMRAFVLSPEEVAKRVSHVVERVSLVANGVLIIATSKIFDAAQANQINDTLKSLLLSKG